MFEATTLYVHFTGENNMRVLLLTSANHPQVRLEGEALKQTCHITYVSINITEWKKGLKSLFLHIRKLIMALLNLRIPPVPLRIFLFSLIYTCYLLDKIKYETQKYDIIYAHWLYPAGLIGLFISKILNIKLVSTPWGYDIQVIPGIDNYGLKTRNRIISKHVLLKSDAVVANHRIHKKTIERFLGKSCDKVKIVYIPAAIPDISQNSPTFFTPELKEKLPVEDLLKKLKVILYAPSLRPFYGIMEFLQAANTVSKRVSDCIFIVVGRGELADKAMEYVKKYKLNDKVIFVGKVSHESMKVLYNLSTLVCDFAYLGTGTTALEALCFGKPVIAFDTPKTIIAHGINGFLIKKGDHECLANYIMAILEDQKLRVKLSMNARSTFEAEFIIQKRINRLMKLFNEVLNNHG
jgi:glycosyltransferase involved in cell wall biosynthesis